MKPAKHPALLTPRQVAELYQVREATVREWLRKGVLKGVKIGGVWRVPREAVEYDPVTVTISSSLAIPDKKVLDNIKRFVRN